MLYRRRNKVLTVQRQLGDSRDVLDRLESEVAKCHPAVSAERKWIGARPSLVVIYNTIDQAKAAERWIDDEFDV